MPDFEFNPPVGIDLGTTFSAIARWNGFSAETYRIRGHDTLQSVVWYDEPHNKHLTDRLAYKHTLIHPEYGIVGVKRMMDNREVKIRLGTKDHSPIELSAKILESIYQEVVKMYTGQFRSRGVVVTVPYYFKAHQCANTREAAESAGLPCIGILQEPIAASLQCALQMVRDHPDAEHDDIMLVFDLGGGTFDLTLFKLQVRHEKLLFEVLATAGDDRLGGLDFDEALMRYILEQEGLVLEEFDEITQRRTRQKLMERCCEVKEELAFTRESFFPVFNVIPGRDINRIVTRDEFERCIEPYMRRVERCMDDLFTRAGVSQQDITRVIKVGGSSRIPAMTALLTDMVGPNKVYSGLRESLCVAEGAAIYAAYLDDPEVFGRDIEITTRTCHALGVEVRGGEFYELIPANRKTPCTREQLFEPESPDQKEVDVEVYQGSSRFVKDNTKIGTVRIPLEPERDRKPDIKVTFKLDAEQMLAVVVKVKFADGGEKEYREAFRFN